LIIPSKHFFFFFFCDLAHFETWKNSHSNRVIVGFVTFLFEKQMKRGLVCFCITTSKFCTYIFRKSSLNCQPHSLMDTTFNDRPTGIIRECVLFPLVLDPNSTQNTNKLLEQPLISQGPACTESIFKVTNTYNTVHDTFQSVAFSLNFYTVKM
jgi:hypothetical protein